MGGCYSITFPKIPNILTEKIWKIFFYIPLIFIPFWELPNVSIKKSGKIIKRGCSDCPKGGGLSVRGDTLWGGGYKGSYPHPSPPNVD